MFRTQAVAGILSLSYAIAKDQGKDTVEPWHIFLALLNLSVAIPRIKAEAGKPTPPITDMSQVFFVPAAWGNMDDIIANWHDFIPVSDAKIFLSDTTDRMADDEIRAAVDNGIQDQDPPLSDEAKRMLVAAAEIDSKLQGKFPVTSLWFAVRDSTDESIREAISFYNWQLDTLSILITHIGHYASLPVTFVVPKE